MKAIPPLHLLLAFDAVARRSSFSKAAEELHLSHSAVSHRIRELERLVEKPLFVRSTRAVALTAEGLHLHQQVQQPLLQLAQAFGAQDGARGSVVRISALPSFARWRLVPALSRLGAQPGWNVEIQPSIDTVDLERGDADIAVRFARTRPAAHHCEKLMDDEWFPVAAPAYLERLGVPAGTAAFRKAVLLAHTRQPWKPWLDKAGIRVPAQRQQGMAFTDTGFVLDAALGLQGIALGRRSLVQELLASGALVRLGEVALPSEQSYYLLASERTAITPQGQQVMAWIRSLAPA
ncbi:DNA-binding transcriptional LysR family regulator [Acidovorax soli]|uniref:DNA-binding transcriptional LysR family regulator n=1 Tax=Acidovorax soli TaxID=592050 RepID=A0A7X0U7B3_9BURK|nr:LysR substrate-binding domain-containing protein [Acidovorax soli]MBB6557788.1 DNA-binding transcriptional LysR family regulator [Acidovorax soli]